jgi:fucose 4-O-acetylase-like acetyltransferase
VRRADLEWLRVAAMVTVFVAHAAHVFTPWHPWHIQNAERSQGLAQLTLFVWPWVMPLFMLLAGAGAWFSLSRRSDPQFRRERTMRLLLPFVIGTLVLIPPQIWVERLAQGRFEGSLFRFYPRFFECCYPRGNLAAGHLWFIAYLWAYSLALVPVLRRLSRPPGSRHVAALARMVTRPGGVLLLAVPLVLTQLALRGAFPQSFDFVRDWANHAILVLAYVYGFLLFSERDLQAAVDRQWQLALPVAAAASAALALYAARMGDTAAPPTPYSIAYFAFWTVFGVAGACWMVVWIGFTRRFLRAMPQALAHASQRLFPIYLLHQTVIVLVAYLVVQWPLGVLPKFVALLALSFTVTVALAEGAVRSARQLRQLASSPAVRKA